MGGVPLVSDWQLILPITAVLLLFIGLFEELCFRVIINEALLYQFRNNKHIFLWIAIISSLLFGWVHVSGVSLDSPIVAAQAVLKILSSGLMGFGLLILYWKTRNFWAISIAHALNDAFPLIVARIFEQEQTLAIM